MIEDVHHVQLAMPQGREDDARAFYCDVLKFREIPKPQELAGRGGLWLQSRNVHLHLGVEVPFSPAKKAHPGFRIRCLEDVKAHLEAHDVAYKTDSDLPGFKRVFVSDPFGNRIELLEVIDAASKPV